jgi:hypothetical protein
MIGMLPVDACMLKPTLQRTTVYEMRNVAAAEFPRDVNVEPERKYLVNLFARNVLSSDDGTARAVVVVAGWKTTHEVTCENRAPTQREPGGCRAQRGRRVVDEEERDC